MRPALVQGVDRSLYYVRWRVEIGFADLQVDDVLALRSSARAWLRTSNAVSVPSRDMRSARRSSDWVAFSMAANPTDYTLGRGGSVTRRLCLGKMMSSEDDRCQTSGPPERTESTRKRCALHSGPAGPDRRSRAPAAYGS